jgi:hypothetical protein
MGPIFHVPADADPQMGPMKGDPSKPPQSAGGPLKPGFGLSGDVHTSQTWPD